MCRRIAFFQSSNTECSRSLWAVLSSSRRCRSCPTPWRRSKLRTPGRRAKRAEAGGSFQQRDCREHGPITDFKLLKHVVEVYFDRALGNVQLARNLLVRQTLGYQAHNLTLAVRQHRQHFFDFGAVYFSFPFGERSWDRSGGALMRSVISLRDRSIVSGFAYFEIALQAPAAIAAVRSSSLSGSVKNTSRVGRFSAFAMARISDPVRSGNVLARSATSGAKFRIASRQLVPCATRRNNLEVVLCCEYRLQPLLNDRLWICDHQSDAAQGCSLVVRGHIYHGLDPACSARCLIHAKSKLSGASSLRCPPECLILRTHFP